MVFLIALDTSSFIHVSDGELLKLVQGWVMELQCMLSAKVFPFDHIGSVDMYCNQYHHVHVFGGVCGKW